MIVAEQPSIKKFQQKAHSSNTLGSSRCYTIDTTFRRDTRDVRRQQRIARAKSSTQAFAEEPLRHARDVPGEGKARVQELHGSIAGRRRARALVGAAAEVKRQPLGDGGHPERVDDGGGEPARGGGRGLLLRRQGRRRRRRKGRRRRGRELLSDLTRRRSDHHSNCERMRLRSGERIRTGEFCIAKSLDVLAVLG